MPNTIILLPLLIALSFQASAQNKWAEYTTTIAGAHFSVFEECGDTTVNNLTYTKIYASLYSLIDSSKFSSSLYALTRQINDSTMFRLISDSQDNLLYDFSVEVGDTLSLLTLLGGISDYKVTQIDTISILSQNRKQITIEHIQYGYEDIWVEGIGSTQRGYFSRGNPTDIIDAGSDFSCFYSANLDTIWSANSLYACLMGSVELTCGETTPIDNYDFQSNIIAYPNPFSSFIELNNLPPKGTISIYNVLGQKVESGKFYSKELKIHTSRFEAGIYIIKVQNSKGEVSSFKMVKQE